MSNYTYSESYKERGSKLWNYDVEARNDAKTTAVPGLSLKAEYDDFRPEVHANIYHTVAANTAAASFTFEWLNSNARFATEEAKQPATQLNPGFNLGLNVADGVYAEGVGDLNVASYYIGYQAAISLKIIF